MTDRDGLQLVHDVQDGRLVDRVKNRVGRVDALSLALRPDGQLEVAAILIGGPVRARRVGRAAVWLHGIVCRILGVDVNAGESRIPFAAVRVVGEDIVLDVDGAELPSGHLERWLGAHVIGRIPASRGDTK
jgi:hypothetical protein